MGMVVQHNMNAINSYNKLNANVAGMKKSSEKLSSGYRINRAGDDAAGLAVSEKMRSQIKGLNQAIRNSQDGINMIQTFEGAAQESHSILQRMKELASQSANGTYDDPTDRAAIQLEFDQLNDELNQIADTDFNGTIVLNGGQMADGTKAVNNKFDYANSQRNPMQLDKSFVTRLDSQLIDTAAAPKGTNADKVWASVFDDVNRTDADGTNDGPESFEVTLRYDESAATATKKWVGVEATNGAKLDQITVTGTANGGFKLTAGGVDFTNAVIDQTALKNGDTITLKVSNPLSPIAAPTNAGATLSAGTLTTGTDAAALKKAEDADLTVAIPTAINDAAMTQDIKDRYDALNGAEVQVKYAADGSETFSIGGTDLSTTAKPVTIGGKTFSAKIDAGKLQISDKDGGTVLLELTAKDQTPTANASTGTLTYTIGIENAKFGTDKLPSVEVSNPTNGAVSKANSFSNSNAIMTYAEDITLQTGARTKDSVNFTFNYNQDGSADMGDLKANLNISARKDGLNTENLSLATQEDANAAIDQIDKAINKVSMVRASFGSIQNRLEHKITNLTTTSENLTEAESSIRDTDMASEMMNYTKFNILQQAAQSMLAQANQQPQSILQLLG